jgi:hypothetical protein
VAKPTLREQERLNTCVAFQALLPNSGTGHLPLHATLFSALFVEFVEDLKVSTIIPDK